MSVSSHDSLLEPGQQSLTGRLCHLVIMVLPSAPSFPEQKGKTQVACKQAAANLPWVTLELELHPV